MADDDKKKPSPKPAEAKPDDGRFVDDGKGAEKFFVFTKTPKPAPPKKSGKE